MKLLVKLTLLALITLQATCSSESATADSSAEKTLKTVSTSSVPLAEIEKKVQAVFTRINPKYKIISATESGIEGFYRVQVTQGPAIYVNSDVTYFFTGDAFLLDEGKLVNLTDTAMDSERLAVMSSLNESDMLVFDVEPPMTRKAQITVFTDVDCFYCQKLHKEVPELNKNGIAVRYMAFPRAGVGSVSYDKIVSAWCADDPQTAMTQLKRKQPIAKKTCENPVADQYRLGQAMGVTGTPAILLDDGTLLPGYRPAKKLIELMGEK